jgi:hypothetical protein
VNPYVKNPNVIGNATNQIALNQNANLFVKILTVSLKLSAALVQWELPELLNPSHSSKKLKPIKIVVNANIKDYFRIKQISILIIL